MVALSPRILSPPRARPVPLPPSGTRGTCSCRRHSCPRRMPVKPPQAHNAGLPAGARHRGRPPAHRRAGPGAGARYGCAWTVPAAPPVHRAAPRTTRRSTTRGAPSTTPMTPTRRTTPRIRCTARGGTRHSHRSRRSALGKWAGTAVQKGGPGGSTSAPRVSRCRACTRQADRGRSGSPEACRRFPDTTSSSESVGLGRQHMRNPWPSFVSSLPRRFARCRYAFAAAGYGGGRTELVRATCLYVATKPGDIMDELVVAGGLVPSLLVNQQVLPTGADSHAGTICPFILPSTTLSPENQDRVVRPRVATWRLW